jgi:hypothetical protein
MGLEVAGFRITSLGDPLQLLATLPATPEFDSDVVLVALRLPTGSTTDSVKMRLRRAAHRFGRDMAWH